MDLSSISTFVRPGFDDGRSGGEGCFSLLWNAIRMAGNKRMFENMASKTAPVVNRPKLTVGTNCDSIMMENPAAITIEVMKMANPVTLMVASRYLCTPIPSHRSLM